MPDKPADTPKSDAKPAIEPGSVITPSALRPLPDPTAQPVVTSSQPAAAPVLAPPPAHEAPVIETPPAPDPIPAPQPPEPPTSPAYFAAEDDDVPSTTEPSADTIQWTASEYIAHDKSHSWFWVLGGITAVLAVAIWLITKDFITTVVIIVGAIAFGVYGAHEPKAVEYQLDFHGITIGQRYHPIDDFRSFSVLPEGAFSSIVLMPLKRFAPLTSIYYAPEDEAAIMEILGATLPFEDRSHDLVDRLMKRIHF